jgi:hypothetical protein
MNPESDPNTLAEEQAIIVPVSFFPSLFQTRIVRYPNKDYVTLQYGAPDDPYPLTLVKFTGSRINGKSYTLSQLEYNGGLAAVSDALRKYVNLKAPVTMGQAKKTN